MKRLFKWKYLGDFASGKCLGCWKFGC